MKSIRPIRFSECTVRQPHTGLPCSCKEKKYEETPSELMWGNIQDVFLTGKEQSAKYSII